MRQLCAVGGHVEVLSKDGQPNSLWVFAMSIACRLHDDLDSFEP